MGKFDLGPAEKERWKITNQQQKEISDIYSELAKQARDKAEKLKGKENISAKLQQAQLNKLAGDLSDSAKSIEAKLSNTVKQGIESVSKAVVVSSQAFNKSVGLGIEGAYSHVPKGIVESLVSGNLYKGDWSLSKAIYTDVSKVQKDINTVVAQGLAANKSAYEIAKDLEMYVDPKAKKPWDWDKVYPGTRKQIDYNAQRLARTMTAHAYEQSLLVVTQPNPFVTGIKWRSAMVHGRTCEICRERNGKVYPKDELPLDHPNGLCTFLAEIPDSLEDIADRIADWAQGKDDPDIDTFASKLSPELNTFVEKRTETSPVSKYAWREPIEEYDPRPYVAEEGHILGYDKEKIKADGLWNFSEDDYNKSIDKWSKVINKQIEKGTPSMQINQNSLEGVLSSGQFKTVYQTGLKDWKTGVNDYLSYRTDTEKTMFGITDPSKGSPVYGYINTGSKIRDCYGDIQIRFKREILDNCSFTVGDSLETRVRPFTLGQNLTKENLIWRQPYSQEQNASRLSRYAEYIEFQYHSELTVSDIEEIVLPKKHDKGIEELLDKSGINWRIGK